MPGLRAFQERLRPAARPRSRTGRRAASRSGSLDVVATPSPTVLIGMSGQPGAFTEDVVRAMARHVERPVIFPLSNPTSRAEATPADLIAWTDGRAMVATGSPFAPVLGTARYVQVDQTNNSLRLSRGWPGRASRSARAASPMACSWPPHARSRDVSPARQNPDANLLPPVSQLRDVSLRVAQAVALQAHKDGLTEPMDAGDIYQVIRDKMWTPVRPYRRSG